MARKLPGLRRELDAQSLFSVAYGEIASSIYFALGVIALRVVVVPMELPLDADLTAQEDEADRLLDEAHAVAESYGVRNVERLLRSRHAGRAIVEEAERRQAEIIVLGAPRSRHRQIFGATVDYVLKHAPCRVMVAAGRREPVPV